MWREWRICLGEMEIWDGLEGSKRCSDGFVVLSGVEQTVWRGRGAVWQQQTLWSVFVTNGHAGRHVNLSHFQVLIALGRQHLPSVLPLNTTQNLLSGCKLPRRCLRHVRSTCEVIVLFHNTPKVVRAASPKTLDLCVELHGFTPQNCQIYAIWLWFPKTSLDHQPTWDGMIVTGVQKPQAPLFLRWLIIFVGP